MHKEVLAGCTRLPFTRKETFFSALQSSIKCFAPPLKVLCPTIELGPWPLPSGGDLEDGSCYIVQSALKSFIRPGRPGTHDPPQSPKQWDERHELLQQGLPETPLGKGVS